MSGEGIPQAPESPMVGQFESELRLRMARSRRNDERSVGRAVARRDEQGKDRRSFERQWSVKISCKVSEPGETVVAGAQDRGRA